VSETRIGLEVNPPVAEIVLDRPEKLNAMDMPLVQELEDAAVLACHRRDVSVVAVRGTGRAFCAGLDLDMLADSGMPTGFYATQESALRILELTDKITVAVLHGHCLGGGLQIAIACDIRIATADCVLGLPAVSEGLFPGMAPYRLPALVGLGAARRLILSGETIDAAAAHEIGLVDHVVTAGGEDSDEVRAILDVYASAPRTAARASKRLLNDDRSYEHVLQRSMTLLAECLTSPEVAVARAARRAGRRNVVA
jgi:enoyl-CoA hydratase/carnithine racemase